MLKRFLFEKRFNRLESENPQTTWLQLETFQLAPFGGFEEFVRPIDAN